MSAALPVSSRIVLTGFMGSGKTTVAMALGKRLRCSVRDLDKVFEDSTGRTPSDTIKDDGEIVFRAAESEVLRALILRDEAHVIALGGGTWMVPENRELLKSQQLCSVWLDPPFELCWSRIRVGGENRPLARNEDEARMLYEQRRPYYELADKHVVVTAEKSVQEIVQEITESFVHLL
jgi:shikimate kinase